jgi:hypothetical protein
MAKTAEKAAILLPIRREALKLVVKKARKLAKIQQRFLLAGLNYLVVRQTVFSSLPG